MDINHKGKLFKIVNSKKMNEGRTLHPYEERIILFEGWIFFMNGELNFERTK